MTAPDTHRSPRPSPAGPSSTHVFGRLVAAVLRPRTLLTVLTVAALVAMIVANRSELSSAGRALRAADPGWLLIGTVALGGWWGSWVVLHATSRTAVGLAGGWRETSRLTPLTLGAICLNFAVKSGGLAGLTLFDVDGRSRGLPRGRISAAYLLATAFAEVAFLVTLAAGLLLVWLDGRLTTPELVAVVVFLLMITVRGAAVVAAVRSRQTLRRLWSLPARAWDRLRRRPARSHDTTVPDELFEAVTLLRRRPRAALLPLAAAVAIDGFGAVMLWAALGAVGAGNHASTALIAYVISVLFSIVGVLPGGVGFAEVGAVAVLASFGTATGIAAAAAVIFRVWEFWLPLLVGSPFAWRGRGHASTT